MFGPQRHENLADALPAPVDGSVVDLGCGKAPTLVALAARLDPAARLVGVDVDTPTCADARIEVVVADLNDRCRSPTRNSMRRSARTSSNACATRMLWLPRCGRAADGRRGAGFVRTLVFSAADVDLTRSLVHRFCDAVQPWMAVADGTVGRRLVALGRRSPMTVVQSFAWVGHHTTFEQGGPAHMAARLARPPPARKPSYELARSLSEHGAVLRRAGRRRVAREPLRRALDLADRCGALRLTTRAREELVASGARPRRAGLSGTDALTPSERRVAQLAADGLTNRDIAKALFVTLRTVEGHLTQAYLKLGIGSRAQLAAALPAREG